ncbi:MAG: hypothetical protein DHS20C16_07120 [Phycisphaerae bacterium]|nr:MAG: hypothetical protein DHS20C16_07120 [Phycisphaerae bacterium]
MTPVDPQNFDSPRDDEFKVIEIQSTLTEAKQPEAVILKEIENSGYDEDSTFAIKLALEEAMTNAVRHGNCGDANKKVRVRYIVSPRRVIICVRDEGCGFSPEEIPDPTTPDRLSLPCGRGIMLIRAYMNEVEYREDGREICMTKINPANA